MIYENIREAVFIKRNNRFSADVIVDGKNEKVHIKNTGRLKELLIKGNTVILEKGKNTERKTRYSIIAVKKENELVNIDSQAPNLAAFEALKEGKISEIGMPDFVKREVKYGTSRFDIYYEKDNKKGFIEVKGVTLDDNGTARFPDAPTQRGTRHLRELSEAVKEGYECSALFVVQMKNISKFEPNYTTDPEFSAELINASKNGVNILAYDCIVKSDSLKIDKKIKVELDDISTVSIS